MATEAQIEANRRNAQKSTGPTSVAGKARVSRNATRHGLCDTLPVMSDEDRPHMEKILNNLNEEHQPDGMTEIILVYKMALNFLSCWRAHILLAERLDLNDQQDESKQVALMHRYANTADRAFNRNLHDLRKLQKERQKEQIGFVSPIPMRFDPDNVKPDVKPTVELVARPETVGSQPDFSALDPDIEPLFPVSPPQKAA